MVLVCEGAKTQFPVGNPVFRPPEMAEIGAELTPATNVWQLAATAYAGITGEDLIQPTYDPATGRTEMPIALLTGSYVVFINQRLNDAKLTVLQQEAFHSALARNQNDRPNGIDFIDQLDRVI